SAPNGYIYRIDRKGKAFVIHDSSLAEVKAIAVDRTGLIYATAIASGETPPGEGEGKRGGSPIRALSGAPPAAAAVEAEPAGASAPEPRADGRKSEAYRISKDGVVELMFSSDEDLFYSLLVRNDGTVLIGSGKRGRIFSVDRLRSATLLVQ